MMWIQELLAGLDGASTAFQGGIGSRSEEIARMGTWAYAPALEALKWSENQFRLWGLEPDSTGPTLATLVSIVHPEDRDLIRRGLANADPGEKTSTISYRVVLPDGRVRHHESGALVIRETRAAGAALLGFVRDVTDLRTAQREIAARTSVSEALDRWEDSYRGPERLLRGLSQALDCERAVFWVVRDGMLRPSVSWATPRSAEPSIARADVGLARGQGVAGLAWATRKVIARADAPQQSNDDDREPPRSKFLPGLVAIPVVKHDEVQAVVALASRHEIELDDRLRATLTGVSRELGYFLARRRAWIDEPVLTAREVQILGLASAGHSAKEMAAKLFVTESTVKTHLEHTYAKLGVHDRAAAVATALRQGLID